MPWEIQPSIKHLPHEGDSLTGKVTPPLNLGNASPGPEVNDATGVSPEDSPPVAGYPSPPPSAPAPPAGVRQPRDEAHRTNGNGRSSFPEGEEYVDSWADFFRFNRENLVVDRRRYEAMIYELGKLGAWQEFFKKQNRETKGLREKIEAKWSRELEYFRELASKTNKKGWRKW